MGIHMGQPHYGAGVQPGSSGPGESEVSLVSSGKLTVNGVPLTLTVTRDITNAVLNSPRYLAIRTKQLNRDRNDRGPDDRPAARLGRSSNHRVRPDVLGIPVEIKSG